MPSKKEPLEQRLKNIRLIITDVDGVLTDGQIILSEDGMEIKSFSVKDGLGFVVWRKAGNLSAIVSGRQFSALTDRAEQLHVNLLRMAVSDKLSVCREVAEVLGVPATDLAYIGDDINDLAPIGWAGVSLAPADAAEEVRKAADIVTRAAGGRGVFREAVEIILKAQDKWDTVVKGFTLEP